MTTTIYLCTVLKMSTDVLHTISDDLAMEALGMTNVVKQVDTLDDLQISNFVIFPTLDLDPTEPRSDFALMCKDLFRYA